MSNNSELAQNPLYKQVIMTCGSIDNFATAMGLTKQGAYKKIKNLKKWTIEDIEKARQVLHINNVIEFSRIFFE